MTAANHLALFHGKIDFLAARVTDDDVELRADGFFENFGKNVAGTGKSRGAALRRLFRLDDVADGFERRVGAKVKHLRPFFLGADPLEFAHIELDLAASDQLSKIKTAVRYADGEAVGLGDAVNEIGGHHGARAGHVLHNEVRAPRNKFRHAAGEHARPLIG